MNTIVSPSILAADFLHLADDCTMVENSNADWFHIDVMDGNFVPNISFGMPIIEAMKRITTKPLDVHLMIEDPQRYVKTFADLGADMLNVHYEACTHLHRTLQEISVAGMKPCVTVNPSTPVSLLEDIVDDTFMVLIMSVNPGFGGQKFIPNTLNKIRHLRQIIADHNAKTLIEVDGGINAETGRQCVEAGANVLVAGSYIFASTNPHEAINTLKAL